VGGVVDPGGRGAGGRRVIIATCCTEPRQLPGFFACVRVSRMRVCTRAVRASVIIIHLCPSIAVVSSGGPSNQLSWSSDLSACGACACSCGEKKQQALAFFFLTNMWKSLALDLPDQTGTGPTGASRFWDRKDFSHV
jgi:hypothetical protein